MTLKETIVQVIFDETDFLSEESKELLSLDKCKEIAEEIFEVVKDSYMQAVEDHQ